MNKKINWVFNWGAGGYNTVKASNKSEAMWEALNILGSCSMDLGGVVNLRPDPDYIETREYDRQAALAFN